MSDKTADELIKRFLDLRDHLDEQGKRFQEWAKPFREEMEAIQSELHAKLLELGGDKPALKTASGTAFTTTKKNPRIENRDIYLDWILDNWDNGGNAMLQLREPKVDEVVGYMDQHDGQLPPGVKLEPFTTVSIRRT